MLTMSITNLRSTCQVDHVQLNAISFFINKTYLRLEKSLESQVRNTLSMAWNTVFHTQRRQWLGPWARLRKSSTKTSTQAASFELDRLRYGSLVCPSSAGWRVGGAYLTMDSTMSSSLCGKSVLLQCKAAFARSATVFFAVQNIDGEFFHPIGRVNGIANNSSYSTSEVRTIPSLG